MYVFLGKKTSTITKYGQNIDFILTNKKKYAIIVLSIIYQAQRQQSFTKFSGGLKVTVTQLLLNKLRRSDEVIKEDAFVNKPNVHQGLSGLQTRR